MAYVPVEILKSVVFLGYINKQGKERFGGSAFWISRHGPEDIKADYHPSYLVTAGHVIADMKAEMSSSDKRVRIRVNTTKGSQEWVDTALRFWEPHPKYPKVDLAVLKMPLDDKLWDHSCWPIDLLVMNESVDGNESDR